MSNNHQNAHCWDGKLENRVFFGIYVLFLFMCRWLKFEEDVEDGGERWSKPYVATLSLHSLFELRSCIMNGTVMLDMRANSLEEIAGKYLGLKSALWSCVAHWLNLKYDLNDMEIRKAPFTDLFFSTLLAQITEKQQNILP